MSKPEKGLYPTGTAPEVDLEKYKNVAISFPRSYFPEIAYLTQRFDEAYHFLPGFECWPALKTQTLAQKLYEDSFRFPDKKFYLNYEMTVSDKKSDFFRNGEEMNRILLKMLSEYFRKAPDGKQVQGWEPKRSKLKRPDLWRYFKETQKEIFVKYAVEVTGNFYYPPGGYREWHTNGDFNSGWRMYYVRVLEEGKSWFYFINPASQQLEKIGDRDAYFNLFYVAGMNEVKQKIRPDFFWHSVVSHTHRMSLGMRISQSRVKKLLQKIKKSDPSHLIVSHPS